MIYYYQTHVETESSQVEADTDESAIRKVKDIMGEYMIGVSSIWTDDMFGNARTVWME
jgi:hypothetical protein